MPPTPPPSSPTGPFAAAIPRRGLERTLKAQKRQVSSYRPTTSRAYPSAELADVVAEQEPDNVFPQVVEDADWNKENTEPNDAKRTNNMAYGAVKAHNMSIYMREPSCFTPEEWIVRGFNGPHHEFGDTTARDETFDAVQPLIINGQAHGISAKQDNVDDDQPPPNEKTDGLDNQLNQELKEMRRSIQILSENNEVLDRDRYQMYMQTNLLIQARNNEAAKLDLLTVQHNQLLLEHDQLVKQYNEQTVSISDTQAQFLAQNNALQGQLATRDHQIEDLVQVNAALDQQLAGQTERLEEREAFAEARIAALENEVAELRKALDTRGLLGLDVMRRNFPMK